MLLFIKNLNKSYVQYAIRDKKYKNIIQILQICIKLRLLKIVVISH